MAKEYSDLVYDRFDAAEVNNYEAQLAAR